jgi:hypothetical protein
MTEVEAAVEKLEKEGKLRELLQDTGIFTRCIAETKKRIVGEDSTSEVIFLCAQGRLVENAQTARCLLACTAQLSV